jgi:di/tripeptidase
LVNPAFAMASAAARISRLQVPKNPKTTFNVGVYGGGTSVNAIAVSVWMEVDMRSESPAELAKLEEQFLTAVKEAVEEENKARSTEQGALVADPKLVGDRKGGQTPPAAPIVQTAAAVTRALGKTPSLRFGSTDSNIPIGLGVPAITIGSGGRGGRAHSLDEWVDVDKASTLPGMQRALLLILALVGVQETT